MKENGTIKGLGDEPVIVLLVVLVCVAFLIVSRYWEDRGFVRYLAASPCPVCGKRDGADAAERALLSRKVHVRAVLLRCPHCGSERLLATAPSARLPRDYGIDGESAS
jgi:hypothetical protein